MKGRKVEYPTLSVDMIAWIQLLSWKWSSLCWVGRTTVETDSILKRGLSKEETDRPQDVRVWWADTQANEILTIKDFRVAEVPHVFFKGGLQGLLCVAIPLDVEKGYSSLTDSRANYFVYAFASDIYGETLANSFVPIRSFIYMSVVFARLCQYKGDLNPRKPT